LWKRASDFPVPLRAWNQGLPDPADLDAQATWFAAVSALQREGVLVVRHTFAPFNVDPIRSESILRAIQHDGTLAPVSALLPLARTLPEAWMDDIQVQAFARSDSPLVGRAGEVVARLAIAQA
jgi:hypothetical protein